jgi:hypothetical protein
LLNYGFLTSKIIKKEKQILIKKTNFFYINTFVFDSVLVLPIKNIALNFQENKKNAIKLNQNIKHKAISSK